MDNTVEVESCELFKILDEPEKISSFTTILYNKAETVEPEEKNEVPSKSKSNRVCFNCGKDDHNLRECPKPHNQIRIARNRSNFVSRGINKTQEFTRYHKEIDDRFSAFRPGRLSEKLKEAVGLKKDTLPRYIYNMRRLGYPPGWLEEAKISHSGINMLDSNGERVPDPDEEEGEICSVRDKYDASKIIDYPGFNVWPDPGTINETETYGSLPMCYEQRKEAFIDRLNESSLYNDGSLDVDVGANTQLNADDMDVEDLDVDIKYDEDKDARFGFVPPLPQEQLPTPPPPLPPKHSPLLDVVKGEISECNEESSSEQEEGELPSKTTKSLRTKGQEKTSLLTSECAEDELVTTPVQSPGEGRYISPAASPEMSTNESFGRIKSVVFGTPVLNHSSYTALPTPDKFRKDISDVIYFENLPNSTGKYERLKCVLKNVRSKLNRIKADTDNKK
ncbi:zinc finger CCHC domain-containing protein 8 homolog isoform X1 [Rhodnius prolixus]